MRFDSAVRDALAMLFPTECAGCGAADVGVCPRCRAALAAGAPERARLDLFGAAPSRPPTAATIPLGSVPLVTANAYDDTLARLLSAFKERGRVDVAPFLAARLRGAAGVAVRDAVGPAAGSASGDGVVRQGERGGVPRSGAVAGGEMPRGGAGARGDLLVVPVPSRRSAIAKRGYDHLELLIEHALPRTSPVRVLRHVRAVRDQAGLGVDDRAANLRGSLAAHPSIRGRRCILVDDVVTTGATAREGVRALQAAGAEVLAVAAIARVPLASARGHEE